MNSSSSHEAFRIVGAGPAGLAAAITLARAGRRVVVHEAAAEVGSRFQGDHQGLENWTTEKDVLDDLRERGIACNFAATPCREGVAFDAWETRYEIRSDWPLFYLIERGPGSGTLDSALLAQAQKLGVEVRFNSRVRQIEGPGILGAGPRAADAIAVGLHFETSMPGGWWVICDDDLAPQGYAQRIVHNYAMERSQAFSAAPPPIDYRPRVWYNSELRYSYFMVLSMIALAGMLVGVITSAASIMRFRKRMA